MDKISIKCDCTDCNGSRQTGICNFDINNLKIDITPPPPNSPLLSTKTKLRKRKNSTDKNEIK